MVKTSSFNYRHGSQQGSPGNFYLFRTLLKLPEPSSHTQPKYSLLWWYPFIKRMDEIGQLVKVLVAKAPATKPDHLSSISGNHTVEAKKWLPKIV